MDVMALVYEYRLLLSLQQEFDIPLDERQRARLDALWSLLEGKHQGPDRSRVMVRFPYPASVRFSSHNGIGQGEILNLSGGGVAIRTEDVVDLDTQIIVRVEGANPGDEFIFPCRVVWVTEGASSTVGLTFEGAPSMVCASVPHLLARAA